MDENEEPDCGEPTVKLTPEWLSLMEKLWASDDDRSIVDFLPEIVDRIKGSKNRAIAETGLLNILHSPKVQNQELVLIEPTIVVPGYLTQKLYPDAVNFPIGRLRDLASVAVKHFSKGKALSVQELLAIWDAMSAAVDGQRSADEASKERSKRARRKLGVRRPPGRPKKTGQE